MWISNGDQISRIYAGTGALEGKSMVSCKFHRIFFLLQ